MSNKSRKLLERARNTKANWTRQEIDTLLESFDFVIEAGGNHDKVSHSKFPQLLTFLPRHRTVAKYIVRQAVELIDKLEHLQKDDIEEDKEDDDDSE